MNRTFKALAAATFLAVSSSVGAQTGVSEIPFEANIDAVKTSIDLYLGEVGGVGQNSKGQTDRSPLRVRRSLPPSRRRHCGMRR